jgi:flagellar basal body-associated protein FliL
MDNQNEIKKDSGAGPIIGSIIIIILIVLGGLYFLGYVNNQKSKLNQTPEQNTEQVNSQEIADPELVKINDELNATSTDNIDQELNQIDAEIDASLK